MKKFILLVVSVICIFGLCGCEKDWKKEFQVSDIEIEVSRNWDGTSTTNLKYIIKNISNYDCRSMSGIVEFQNGTIKTEEEVYPMYIGTLKSGDSINAHSTILEKNYEGYTATFKNIDCFMKAEE